MGISYSLALPILMGEFRTRETRLGGLRADEAMYPPFRQAPTTCRATAAAMRWASPRSSGTATFSQ